MFSVEKSKNLLRSRCVDAKMRNVDMLSFGPVLGEGGRRRFPSDGRRSRGEEADTDLRRCGQSLLGRDADDSYHGWGRPAVQVRLDACTAVRHAQVAKANVDTAQRWRLKACTRSTASLVGETGGLNDRPQVGQWFTALPSFDTATRRYSMFLGILQPHQPRLS